MYYLLIATSIMAFVSFVRALLLRTVYLTISLTVSPTVAPSLSLYVSHLLPHSVFA
jgi:hypothetical protein